VAVLASLGPIVAFFSISTRATGYGFMVLLNVLVFGISGVLGLTFLIQTLNRLNIARRAPGSPFHPAAGPGQCDQPPETDPQGQPEPPPPPPLEPREGGLVSAELAEEPGPLEQIEGHVLGRHVKKVFGCWVVVFGVVGAQMGWVLRPFVGSPDIPFAWFRARQSNFFEAVFEIVRNLF
jgi:hypothetical protein